MKFRILKSIIAIILIVGVSLSGSSLSVANSLEQARDKQKELEDSLYNAQKMVKELNSSKDDTEDKIAKIEGELTSLSNEQTQLEKELVEIDSRIEQSQIDIENAQTELDKQYELMCSRIAYTYEHGTTSYLEAILSAGSISEALNRIEYVYEIMNYDRQMLQEYEDKSNEIKRMKETLENDKIESQNRNEQINDKQKALEVLSDEKNRQLEGIDQQLVDAKELEEQYRKEVQAQNEVLAQLQAAIAAEEAKKQKEESQSGNKDTQTPPQEETSYSGGMAWPCPSSRRITSEYGLRESPTEGASTNHKGIDIGAKQGADIVAAQSGTVIVSTYSNSAGNYVIIDHGKDANGNKICTVYMHASSRLVSVGDTVSRGQVIALVGSTGYSTGPHLHFAVTVNGSYVNPMGYL